MAHKGPGRQTRLDGAASDIAGSLKTVQSAMNSLQKKQGYALSQHDQTLLQKKYEQSQRKSMTGQPARLQEQVHGRQQSSEEELLQTQTLLRRAIQQKKFTEQCMTVRQMAT